MQLSLGCTKCPECNRTATPTQGFFFPHGEQQVSGRDPSKRTNGLLSTSCPTFCLQVGWVFGDQIGCSAHSVPAPLAAPSFSPMTLLSPRLRSWEEIRTGVNKTCTQLPWLQNGAGRMDLPLGNLCMRDLVTNQEKANRQMTAGMRKSVRLMFLRNRMHLL